MNRNVFFSQISTGSSPGAWRLFLYPGTLLILFGVLILIKPEILAFLVATMIIMAGMFLIGVGLRLRSSKPPYQQDIVVERNPFD